ncbi:hypothetical protein [Kluyvera sichuanensis]
MTLYETVDLLNHAHKHKQLWFYSGMGKTDRDVVINVMADWTWPKILTRHGHAVAEFTDTANGGR